MPDTPDYGDISGQSDVGVPSQGAPNVENRIPLQIVYPDETPQGPVPGGTAEGGASVAGGGGRPVSGWDRFLGGFAKLEAARRGMSPEAFGALQQQGLLNQEVNRFQLGAIQDRNHPERQAFFMRRALKLPLTLDEQLGLWGVGVTGPGASAQGGAPEIGPIPPSGRDPMLYGAGGGYAGGPTTLRDQLMARGFGEGVGLKFGAPGGAQLNMPPYPPAPVVMPPGGQVLGTVGGRPWVVGAPRTGEAAILAEGGMGSPGYQLPYSLLGPGGQVPGTGGAVAPPGAPARRLQPPSTGGPAGPGAPGGPPPTPGGALPPPEAEAFPSTVEAPPTTTTSGVPPSSAGPPPTTGTGFTPGSFEDKMARVAQYKSATTPVPAEMKAQQQIKSAYEAAKDIQTMLRDDDFKEILDANPWTKWMKWLDYSYFGGYGLSPEWTRFLRDAGFLMATGGAPLLAGQRRGDLVKDVRKHLGTPWDARVKISDNIAVLMKQYPEMLAEIPVGSGGAAMPFEEFQTRLDRANRIMDSLPALSLEGGMQEEEEPSGPRGPIPGGTTTTTTLQPRQLQGKQGKGGRTMTPPAASRSPINPANQDLLNRAHAP